MELLSKVETKVTEVVYTIQDEVSTFYYKEWVNDSGKIVDAQLVDKDGYQIDDPVLMVSVEVFLTQLEDTEMPY
ncbi:hypothetical protein EBT16_11200 [bacterium]|nr:hypothetical protein [bacterium]